MNDSTSSVLQDLIVRAKDGDRAAQQALLERYWPLIRKAVRARKARLGRALDRREETEDIQQAAALKVLGELRKHEWRGRSAFAAWIGKLAALEVVDRYRFHRAAKRDTAADTGGTSGMSKLVLGRRSAESMVDDQRKLSTLMKKVAAMKDDYGAALLMHHMGFSHQEIGDALSCSAEAARKLVARAHIKLLDGR